MNSRAVFKREVAKLRKIYGPQNWWPMVYLNGKKVSRTASARVFEVAVGAILTQNAAWTNVEKCLGELAWAGLISAVAIEKSPLNVLQKLIRPAGYYKQKAKKLKALAHFAIREERGSLFNLKKDLSARIKLLSIWGVGPETADTILLYGLDLPYFAVDAYTRRFLIHLTGSNRWKTATYSEVQKFCEESIPKSVVNWQEAHACIVAWGKGSRKKKSLAKV